MHKELKKLRKKIDKIDKNLTKTLGKREKVAIEIGGIKKKYDLPVEDREREKEILENIKNPFIKQVFEEIIRLSKKRQS